MDTDTKTIRETAKAIGVAAAAVTTSLRELRSRGITIELPLIGIIPIKIGPVEKPAELTPDLLSAARWCRQRLDAMGLPPEQVEDAITRIASGSLTMDVMEATWQVNRDRARGKTNQQNKPADETTP